jgi:hypothetical protein
MQIFLYSKVFPHRQVGAVNTTDDDAKQMETLDAWKRQH